MNTTRLAASLLLLFNVTMNSCKRGDDKTSVTIPKYSGFLVDDIIYTVDSLIIDTAGAGCSARLYSATAGGGLIEIRSPMGQWPANDSDFHYLPVPPRALYSGPDSAGIVSICFTPTGDSTPLFCLNKHTALIGPFGIKVRSGKRSFYQYYRKANSEPEHTLGIDYQEP